MIETTIPEIDVNELMERIRAKAAQITTSAVEEGRTNTGVTRTSLPPVRTLTPPPAFTPLRPVNAKRERLEALLSEARAKIEVKRWIPKMFRRLFRKQGGYNRIILDTTASLTKTNEQLGKRVQQLSASFQAQSQWLQMVAANRETDIVWMRMATEILCALQERTSHFTAIGRQLDSLSTMVQQHEKTLSPAGQKKRFDSFYLEFENRFRGARSEIKERFRFYLPLITGAASATGGAILDLGCGRGEWLELLKENGVEASGVDNNSAMISECAERNLKAVHADVIEHLRSLTAESQSGVTGFHIIEHLSFETLMDLLGETRRILKPGGIAIFESPNCKNLLVGASFFHVDPTHRSPVFPDTAQFMLEMHGFEGVEVHYLAPAKDGPINRRREKSEALDELLYGAQDFAVVGYKPET